jgi:hypothetical protein
MAYCCILGIIITLGPVRPSIWNKFHVDITDSGRIYGGLWYHSSMFIPHPGNDSIIVLFTIGVTSAEYGFYSIQLTIKPIMIRELYYKKIFNGIISCF